MHTSAPAHDAGSSAHGTARRTPPHRKQMNACARRHVQRADRNRASAGADLQETME